MKNLFLLSVMILCLNLLSSCSFFSDWFDKDVIDFQPKNIDGIVELPPTSNIDLSMCQVYSFYGANQLNNNSFTTSIQSTTEQQLVYFADEYDNILMLNLVNKEEELEISPTTTAVALIMMFLGASDAEPEEWDKIQAEIVSNKYFQPLREEVEQLIESRTPIFAEDNDELVMRCGKLIDDLIKTEKNATKSSLVGDGILPLITTQNGNKLSLTNNGKSPYYQICVFKDGTLYDIKKGLEASSALKISLGSLITGQYGALVPPSPVTFELKKEGDYEIRASSIDCTDGVQSPGFYNSFNIIHNFLSTAFVAFDPSCEIKVAELCYSAIVANAIELSNMQEYSYKELSKYFIDYIASNINNALEAVKECAPIPTELDAKDVEKVKNNVDKYLKGASKCATWILSKADAISKVESGTNCISQLGLWVYQPKELTFCKKNEKGNLTQCAGDYMFPLGSFRINVSPAESNQGNMEVLHFPISSMIPQSMVIMKYNNTQTIIHKVEIEWNLPPSGDFVIPQNNHFTDLQLSFKFSHTSSGGNATFDGCKIWINGLEPMSSWFSDWQDSNLPTFGLYSESKEIIVPASKTTTGETVVKIPIELYPGYSGGPDKDFDGVVNLSGSISNFWSSGTDIPFNISFVYKNVN